MIQPDTFLGIFFPRNFSKPNFSMLTFQQYLLQHRISFEVLTDKEKMQVRADFKKHYARAYQRELRGRIKRIELVCSKTEYQQLKQIAKQYGEGIGVLSRKAVLAYIESDIYLPPNPILADTKLLIRRSANNVNQLVKASRIHKQIDNQHLEALAREFRQMETVLDQFYQTPKIVFKPIHLIPNAH